MPADVPTTAAEPVLHLTARAFRDTADLLDRTASNLARVQSAYNMSEANYQLQRRNVLAFYEENLRLRWLLADIRAHLLGGDWPSQKYGGTSPDAVISIALDGAMPWPPRSAP